MIYKGEYLKEINFPLGGIGTGSIGLMGNGSLQDWEIFNRPAKGSVNGYSFFAVKAKYPDGKSIVKILQGDWNKDLSGRYTGGASAGFGQGADYYNLCGLPHFRKVTFDGRFPIARLTFEDKDFPAKVIMTAFNPFIPLDADASSIPAAFFDIKFISRVDGVVFTALLTVSNPFKVSKNEKSQKEYTAVTMRHAGVPSTHTEYGDLTVAVDRRDGICQEYWYRGWWPQDRITAFWRELNDGELTDRHYDDVGSGDICTVGASNTLNKGKAASARFVIAWNIPTCHNYWEPFKDTDGNDVVWRNYYATLFGDSLESAIYSLKNWKALYKRTLKFHHILHGSSLDSAVTDAVSSTLSVLKSSTVYVWRTEPSTDGRE